MKIAFADFTELLFEPVNPQHRGTELQ